MRTKCGLIEDQPMGRPGHLDELGRDPNQHVSTGPHRWWNREVCAPASELNAKPQIKSLSKADSVGFSGVLDSAGVKRFSTNTVQPTLL